MLSVFPKISSAVDSNSRNRPEQLFSPQKNSCETDEYTGVSSECFALRNPVTPHYHKIQ